jgi:Eco57I restriction endonuclease.
MQFDIVIGNPPYNNDIYLDFVQKPMSSLVI